MSRIIAFFCIVLTCVFAAASIDTAEAARFGGGRSAGSRAFMSRPATPPSSFTQQRAQAQRPQAAAQAAQPRRSGLMGMFGGLLAGTMLGSLLFGNGGFGGMLSLLLIGGLIFLVFRMVAGARNAARQRQQDPSQGFQDTPFSRSAGQQPGFGFQTAAAGQQPNAMPASENQASQWEMLRGDGISSGPVGGGSSTDADSERVHIPGNFDVAEFTRGAKAAYARLNAAWDRRDLNDIAEFTTADFMAILREQAREDPNPGKTDILLINADLMDVHEDNGDQIASVFFNNVLREDNGATEDVREVWHFVRSADGTGNWKLDGIQQVQY